VRRLTNYELDDRKRRDKHETRQVSDANLAELAALSYKTVLAEGKGKGKGKRIYVALFCCTSHSRRSGMDNTVLPAITPMPAFTK